MPKKPDSRPTPAPSTTSRGSMYAAFSRVSHADWRPPVSLGRSIIRPTTIINTPNSATSFWPSISLPRAAPANAPPTPARLNTMAQGQRIGALRACRARPAAALTATAKAAVPMATCGDGMPTA